MAVPGRVQTDLLEVAAVVPELAPGYKRIDDPRDVRRLRVRLEGADLSWADLDVVGAGQTMDGGVIFMIVAVFYVLVTIALIGWPSSVYLMATVRQVSLSAGQQLALGACFLTGMTLASPRAGWTCGRARALNDMGR